MFRLKQHNASCSQLWAVASNFEHRAVCHFRFRLAPSNGEGGEDQYFSGMKCLDFKGA